MNFFTTLIKSSAGFSMVEAVIGVGLLGGVGVMVMKQSQNAADVNLKMTVEQEANSIAARIQGAMAKKKHCTATIKDETYGNLQGVWLGAVDDTGESGSKLLREAERTRRDVKLYGIGPIPKSKITVKEIKIHEKRDPVTNAVLGDFLSVVLTAGNKQITKDFLLHTQKNGSVFTSCESEMGNEIYEGMAQVCNSIDATYDETAKKCVFTNLPQCYLTEAGECTTEGTGDNRQYLPAGTVTFSEYDKTTCRTLYERAFNPYKCHIASIDTSPVVKECYQYGCSILGPHKSCTVRKLEKYPCDIVLKDKTMVKCCRGGVAK